MRSPRGFGSTLQKQRFCFVFLKRNWDTFIAVKTLRSLWALTKQESSLQESKTPAVTAQHISIENVSIEEAGKVG
jgi:hypothetical protein